MAYFGVKIFYMALREENIRLIFGLKMRQLRIDKGLSLSELAQRTGISVSYLTEIEKARKYPKADKISLLAEALETSYDQLVSLQLDKRLAAVSELLQSHVLTDLPLEMFGVEPASLLELLAGAPTKLSAFISTLIEIGRNYGLGFEGFYFAVLRSFQEMHDNYFADLEDAAAAFAQTHRLQPPLKPELLSALLEKTYGYTISYTDFSDQPALQQLRSLTLPGKSPQLLLHQRLDADQRSFALGRELGYNFVGLSDRAYTATWIEVNNFEQVLNNFRASYFSSALLLPADRLEKDLQHFFEQKQFDPLFLPRLMQSYGVSAETLMHRMTSLLPARFGIGELFFLRFEKVDTSEEYVLTKELHLNGQHNPHATVLNEHYCRRWLSLTAINQLRAEGKELLCAAQQSHYVDSDNQYLLITIATPASAWQPTDGSVSIGLRLNAALKRKIRFWNDPAMRIRTVGETCERCPLVDCESRAAAPRVVQQRHKTAAMKQAVANLLLKNKQAQG